LRSGRTTLKKCCGDKLVLGWFLGLGFAASAGCVAKSVGKLGKVKKSVASVGKKGEYGKMPLTQNFELGVKEVEFVLIHEWALRLVEVTCAFFSALEDFVEVVFQTVYMQGCGDIIAALFW
jgi:hypothetical protein